MWSVANNDLPHFKGRVDITKVYAMITTIDDVYDVYGTLQELEQFTDIVNRLVLYIVSVIVLCHLAIANR